MDTDYPATGRTTPTRYPGRISYQRPEAHAILDEAYVCHLGLVTADGPKVLPTLFARIGDTLYLHGSTGSGPMLALRDGGTVCVTVTQLDGLVFGRSQFHHSANYRSVVCYGTVRQVADTAEKFRAMTALVDKVAAGRSTDSRPPTGRELAATGVIALPLTELSVKVRGGGPVDEPEDLELPYWAGVVPLRLTPDVPVPGAGVAVPVPGYLRPARSPWLEPAVMAGRHVILEPLDMCHAPALFEALDDEEVHRYIPHRRPQSPDEMAATVAGLLRQAGNGLRVPWVARDAGTGEVIGTTSFAPADEVNLGVHIGSTQLGRRWWRTGVNTEAKLMLMTRAFEELGAVRVEWQTDNLNLRSQAAIERLGATREGVLRRHKRRADGTWRDSVFYGLTVDEWPLARKRLAERLAQG
ncbi:MAG TPA: bifunctional pyridoxamine 5'-phosphate oxidase family protein/GNAT family N-acetyltransferase [Rugosimonospora sp.]|jgi:RimJ/RimL family protein N-acetyltransferase/nitroimidazol reductase NimA-like FMN-containing flavoprotein (pyridoxamine 5'-phosphate oxidase superfamily)